jgi:hypothetical protein
MRRGFTTESRGDPNVYNDIAGGVVEQIIKPPPRLVETTPTERGRSKHGARLRKRDNALRAAHSRGPACDRPKHRLALRTMPGRRSGAAAFEALPLPREAVA